MLEEQNAPNPFLIYYHQEIQVWFLSADFWKMQICEGGGEFYLTHREDGRKMTLQGFCYYFLSSCLGCAVLGRAVGVANRTSLLLSNFGHTNPTQGWYHLTASLQNWAWPMQRPWVKRAVWEDRNWRKMWSLVREPKGKSSFSEHQVSLMAVELLFIKGRNIILPMCAVTVDARNTVSDTGQWHWCDYGL